MPASTTSYPGTSSMSSKKRKKKGKTVSAMKPGKKGK